MISLGPLVQTQRYVVLNLNSLKLSLNPTLSIIDFPRRVSPSLLEPDGVFIC
jgi:hypothetical protein